MHTAQSHDAIDVGLLILRTEFGTLLCRLLGELSRCSGFEFSGDALQVIGHLRIRLEEEQLQIACFILELYLRSVGEDIADTPIWSKKGQDL